MPVLRRTNPSSGLAYRAWLTAFCASPVSPFRSGIGERCSLRPTIPPPIRPALTRCPPRRCRALLPSLSRRSRTIRHPTARVRPTPERVRSGCKTVPRGRGKRDRGVDAGAGAGGRAPHRTSRARSRRIQSRRTQRLLTRAIRPCCPPRAGRIGAIRPSTRRPPPKARRRRSRWTARRPICRGRTAPCGYRGIGDGGGSRRAWPREKHRPPVKLPAQPAATPMPRGTRPQAGKASPHRMLRAGRRQRLPAKRAPASARRDRAGRGGDRAALRLPLPEWPRQVLPRSVKRRTANRRTARRRTANRRTARLRTASHRSVPPAAAFRAAEPPTAGVLPDRAAKASRAGPGAVGASAAPSNASRAKPTASSALPATATNRTVTNPEVTNPAATNPGVTGGREAGVRAAPRVAQADAGTAGIVTAGVVTAGVVTARGGGRNRSSIRSMRSSIAVSRMSPRRPASAGCIGPS